MLFVSLYSIHLEKIDSDIHRLYFIVRFEIINQDFWRCSNRRVKEIQS